MLSINVILFMSNEIFNLVQLLFILFILDKYLKNPNNKKIIIQNSNEKKIYSSGCTIVPLV
jgi:hypothetical protein